MKDEKKLTIEDIFKDYEKYKDNSLNTDEDHFQSGKFNKNLIVLDKILLRNIFKKSVSGDLSNEDYKLYFYILAYMDEENKIMLDYNVIEYNTGIKHEKINNCINNLIECKMIIKNKNKSKNYNYLFIDNVSF
jgi:hypothetical protein